MAGGITKRSKQASKNNPDFSIKDVWLKALEQISLKPEVEGFTTAEIQQATGLSRKHIAEKIKLLIQTNKCVLSDVKKYARSIDGRCVPTPTYKFK